MFCRVKQSLFSIHRFSDSLALTRSANHLLPLPFKTHLQIPSMLFCLTSSSIAFTCLPPWLSTFSRSHLLPAIIQFCSLSSCFHCVLYVCVFQTWLLQGAQHHNELKFTDKDDKRIAKVQRQNVCTILLQTKVGKRLVLIKGNGTVAH